LNHPKACADKRQAFQKRIEAYQQAEKPLVFIDESGFAHDMPRTHGYSKQGNRCYGIHDWGAKGRTNAIGALIGKTLLTVSLFMSNVNTEIFSSWIEQDLLPKLPQNSVIVMDNASFHKSKVMQEKIMKAGHILEYLPPYSPDLNPIEKKWAQIKSIRRKERCSINDLFSKFT